MKGIMRDKMHKSAWDKNKSKAYAFTSDLYKKTDFT